MNTFKTAIRYAFSKRNAQRTSSVIIIIGLALSIAALIIIGSVVNALQTRQLDMLKAVESFDLIVESSLIEEEDIASLENVSSCYPFAQTTAIIGSQAIRIRALDINSFSVDKRVKEFFTFSNISKDGLLLSLYKYKTLDLKRTDKLNATFFKRGKSAAVIPVSKELELSGIFSCSDQTFSQTTAFVDLETYKKIIGNENIKYGLFINGNQKNVISNILQLDSYAKVTTWQEYNKATYSALMLEKVLIYIFMSFMFVILCTSLRNSTQRLISNRKKEAATLRAIGLTKNKVTEIFLIQGIVLTIIGEITGIIIGTAIVDNMDYIFKIAGFQSFIFIDVKYSAMGLLLLFILVLLLSVLFTEAACKKLRKNEIMEVLLHENY